MTAAIVFPAFAPVRPRELGKYLLLDPHARRRLAEADEALGHHLADALADADENDDQSVAVQLAFAVACLALADNAEAEGLDAAYCVGPSFGERPALAYTGALPFGSVIQMVDEIARVEREYFATEHRDIVTHSFVRVGGQQLADLLAGLDARGVWHEISGYLDPDFHMLSLPEGELDALKTAISDAGGYSLHTTWPPAHAAIFAGLRDRMVREVYDRYELSAPRIPVVSYQDGRLMKDPAELRADLADGLVRPIRWLDAVQALRDLDVTELCVAGPDSMFHRLKSSRDLFRTTLVDHRRILRRPRRRPA
ncbi:ACP S-malonyltransferase [Parafrankia sp. FMc2]|uniref:ACP S-malonyltransferase n=1 Tax=Parafrankia sp. FMc2 TaxID=3233196 RepID=UPI0034D5F500